MIELFLISVTAALRNQQVVLQALNQQQGGQQQQQRQLLPNLGRNSSVTIQVQSILSGFLISTKSYSLKKWSRIYVCW